MPNTDSAAESSLPALGKKALVWWALSLVIIVLDQWTKTEIVARFAHGEYLPLSDFFNLVRAHNYGAAFSFLADAGGWQKIFFAVIAVVATVVMSVWLTRLNAGERWLACALALIIGGAVGNVYDRIALGYVVDFLDFYWQGYHFPAFNVADIAISTGAVMMAIDVVRNPK